ncbi:MAG: DNA polymerase III subunit delta, partial [Sulfurovum sp.]|nr:DNA polymerase III subunit delta [Sulfurovum sp.]MCB4747716.1 DNA polymerase III subunit delta [Sulfurovum sp.]MCB4752268.1 DNA polymerase III subunit delta [Sulfurovum sp.]MCB4755057.1 DNA polymerase III subunit delta [Sulfurovum sp.]MCB4757759.1 DNA polymerase III subunit delta [Sulfurovum sp.]
MYQREFDQRLKQALPKAVLLYGENDYLIDHYIKLYIDNLDAKESMLSLYHDEWNFEQTKNFLSQTSLFGGTNLVVIKHEKKIPKKELDILIELANKNSDNYFIYSYSGTASNAKTLQSSFTDKKGGVWVRFFEPNIRDSIPILQQKATKIGLDIDHYALQHLMLLLNNNLTLCINELDKLAILNTRITSKDIDRLVYSTAPLAVETLLMEIFNKKPITTTISKLLELGEDEFSILRVAQYFINEIFLINAYIKIHGQPDFKEIFGFLPPQFVRDQKQQLALRVKSISLLKIYEHLLESEIVMKQAPIAQREVLLYSMLIKIQQYL